MVIEMNGKEKKESEDDDMKRDELIFDWWLQEKERNKEYNGKK